MIMSLKNSLDNSVKEAQTNNGEGLSPGRCPVGEQRRPGHHQTTARNKRRQKKTINFQSLVILKQKRKVKEDIENKSANNG